MSKKLKVILSKQAHASRVVDAETGDVIEGVIDIHIELDASTTFTPVAHITIVSIDIEAMQEQEQ